MRTRASKRSWKNVNRFGDTVKQMKSKIQLAICLICVSVFFAPDSRAQKTSHSHASMSAETNALVDSAIGVVCTQAKLDPQSSIPIDDMHARPSLPVQRPEAQDGSVSGVFPQAKLDPQSSIQIADMQARPSLPVQSPEAQAGAERAQRLLPQAKALMISSLRQLVTDYGLDKTPRFQKRMLPATARVNNVKRVEPDLDL